MNAAYSVKWEEKRRWYSTVVLIVAMIAALLAPGTSASADLPLLQSAVEDAAGSAGQFERFIVQETATAGDGPELLVGELGGVVVLELGIIDAFVADIPASAATVLLQHPEVAKVTPDSSVDYLWGHFRQWEGTSQQMDALTGPGSMYEVTEKTRADDAWSWYQATGDDVTVAIIDSGVTPVAGLSDGRLINGPDLSFESQTGEQYVDTFGHGTHLAGIIAGRDRATRAYGYSYNHDDEFTGMAPDADVLSVRTAGRNGATDVSQIIAAIDWVVQHRNDNGMNVRVLNLSFGTDGTQDYLLDPLAYAVEQAWKAGIVVVVAAGNDGNSALLRNPAYDPFVIAVGAADGNSVASFSNCGDRSRHVDIVAPGRSIVSLRTPGSYADVNNPDAVVQERFFVGSGTSQAAAVVSGAVAQILDAKPYLEPDEVKSLLMESARRFWGVDSKCQGSGMLDVAGALRQWVPWDADQKATPSKGNGSLDAARGSYRISMDGVELNGEQDIFGQAWDGDAHAELSAMGVSWSGGDWNGVSWSGVSWSGVSWSGVSWSGVSWSGVSWSGVSWSGVSWSGVSWSAGAWSGVSWDGPVPRYN